MINNPVYLEAAEKVCLSPYPMHSCCTISDVQAERGGTDYSSVCAPRRAYDKISAAGKPVVDRWSMGGTAHRSKEAQQHRVYLLLMAHYFEGWEK